MVAKRALYYVGIFYLKELKFLAENSEGDVYLEFSKTRAEPYATKGQAIRAYQEFINILPEVRPQLYNRYVIFRKTL